MEREAAQKRLDDARAEKTQERLTRRAQRERQYAEALRQAAALAEQEKERKRVRRRGEGGGGRAGGQFDGIAKISDMRHSKR